MIVVLFSITMRDGAPIDEEESESERMWAIVSPMPGFISYKAYTAADGETIAVVRFESRDALDAWKAEPRHRRVQERAREAFYEAVLGPGLRDLPIVQIHQSFGVRGDP